MAPFVCPVNYSRSKLSGNEVPGLSLGPSSRLPSISAFLFLSGYLARHCPIPAGHPPVERERTNKSARALRRDIVSCKVNHLRGSKTASSPRRNLLSSPRGGLEETFVTSCTPFLHDTFCSGIATSVSHLLALRVLRTVFGTNEPSSWSVQLASISGHIASSLASSDP